MYEGGNTNDLHVLAKKMACIKKGHNIDANLFEVDVFCRRWRCLKYQFCRCGQYPNMHDLFLGVELIFLISLALRQISCFRCRIDEQDFIAHRICIVIFLYAEDTEFTFREFLLSRRASSWIAKHMTHVRTVGIQSGKSFASMWPFLFYLTRQNQKIFFEIEKLKYHVSHDQRVLEIQGLQVWLIAKHSCWISRHEMYLFNWPWIDANFMLPLQNLRAMFYCSQALHCNFPRRWRHRIHDGRVSFTTTCKFLNCKHSWRVLALWEFSKNQHLPYVYFEYAFSIEIFSCRVYMPTFILYIIINVQCGGSSLLVLSLATRQRPSVLLRNDCAATLD